MPLTPDTSAYFRVDRGPLRDLCEDWRRRTHRAKDAMWGLAEKYGTPGYLTVTPSGRFAGLQLAKPIPNGWSTLKVLRNGGALLVPADNPAGAAIQEEIDAMPQPPNLAEIEEFLNIPKQVVCQTKDGKKVEEPVRNNRIPAVNLSWRSKEGPILLRAPDAERVVQWMQAKYPDARIVEGHWAPPAGLSQISREQFDAILAEDEERADVESEAVRTPAKSHRGTRPT